MSFAIVETLPGGGSRLIASEATLLQAIARSLDQLDTVDLLELQRKYVPEARLAAVASQERTRPVKLPEPTAVVPAAAIRREFNAAAVEAGGEGELD
jgi:hypothetical protein